jgi:hypothetical protein
MPDFGKLFGKAKEQAGKHPDQVQKGIDKLQDLADKHLDDKYDGQIQKAGDMAEQALGMPGQDGAGTDTAQQDSAEPQDGSR